MAKSEAHFNLKIAYLYCDNENEYLSNDFKSFCVQKVIQYHLTVPYTPRQNSVAERMNRSLVEKARAMIHGADLGKELWGEAILSATYLLNVTPTKAVPQTPYELWHDKKPSLEHLRVFGCTVYVHDKTRKSKFDKKSCKGILVGYEQNGYKILNTETNKFISARDVIFDEIDYKKSRPSVHTKSIDYENADIKRQKTDETLKISKESEINKSVPETEQINKKSDNDENSQNESNDNTLRRSARIKGKPIISYNEDYCYQYAQSIVCETPTSYHEIKDRDDKLEWEKAIQDEIDSLLENNTWNIVPCPVKKNIVDCIRVFSIQNDIYGNLTKYKARLVAKGFSQKYLLDYN